jgi:hypothetical protein
LRLSATELAMRVWLRCAALAARRRPSLDVERERRALVDRLAPGGSFADVGGMWNVYGRVAFQAEEAGASPVVLMDVMDPVAPFQEEHARRGSSVRYVQGDLHDERAVAAVGPIDTVWCTGMLYHTPNPFGMLASLRRMTRRHLLLGSHIIPEVPGFPHACVFYPPGLPEPARRSFVRAHRPGGGEYVGVTTPFMPAQDAAYANFWFGFTPSALRAMLRAAHFEVLEEKRWSPFLLDVLCRPVGDEQLLPEGRIFHDIHHRRLALLGEELPPWLAPDSPPARSSG